MKTVLLLVAGFLCLCASSVVAADEAVDPGLSGRPFAEEAAAGGKKAPPPDKPALHLLTRYVLEGEFALMAKNFSGHAVRTHRVLKLRLMEWGPWFIDTRYQEELLFGYALDQVNHTFDYFKFGRDFGPVDVSVFWNHTCYNEVWGRGNNGIHWNDTGFEVSTDSQPGAERLHDVHLNFRAATMFMLANAEYLWTIQGKGHLRHNVPDGASPYADLLIDVVGDHGRVTVAPVLEVGFTIPLGPALAVEPFLRIEKRRDGAGESPGNSDTWFLLGMKLVHRIDEKTDKGPRKSESDIPVGIQAGYAARLFQKEIGYVSNVSFRFDVPGLIPGGRAYFEVHNGVNTPPNDMFPNFMTMTAGPTVEGEWGPARIRASYRYRERRAVGSHWTGPTLRILHGLTLEVEPGDGLPDGHKINPYSDRFRWGVFAACYPFRLEFPYLLEMGCRARVHLFRVKEIP
ncbi:MAG: hypothetical protein ACYTFG_05710, partial [Planctomycetota bacterium]